MNIFEFSGKTVKSENILHCEIFGHDYVKMIDSKFGNIIVCLECGEIYNENESDNKL